MNEGRRVDRVAYPGESRGCSPGKLTEEFCMLLTRKSTKWIQLRAPGHEWGNWLANECETHARAKRIICVLAAVREYYRDMRTCTDRSANKCMGVDLHKRVHARCHRLRFQSSQDCCWLRGLIAAVGVGRADERVRKTLRQITATEHLRGSNRHKSDVHGHRFKKRASCLRTLV